MNAVEMVKGRIVAALERALLKGRDEGRCSFESIPSFVLEAPRDKGHGDFAANLAMVMAKETQLPPRRLAQIILDHFDKEGADVETVEIAGPGFINFRLSPRWLYGVIPAVQREDERYGSSDAGQGRKVQVEFVSANPTGLLHMGNARGAALGDTLANLLRLAGFEVTKEFYINDAGNQIENFAKSLEARYLQLLGQDVEFPEEGYHGEDVIETMKGLIARDGDKYLAMDTAARREALVQYALKEKLEAIRSVLEDFGVVYDVWFSEQTLHQSGAVQETIGLLREKGYIYESEGALWFKGTAFGEEKDEVVVRSNGVPTYFAADIAYHKNKFDRGFDWVINIWGADHHGHVSRMKGAVQAVGYDPDKLDVILMQLVRLYRGGEIVRMSKRSGQYVTLGELIEEVGKDAARFFFVMRGADSHLDFDLDLAKSQSSENPVFYVQYAHARICSILRTAAEQGCQVPLPDQADYSLLRTEAELDLIRKIADFPGEVAFAALRMEPHRMARYAQDLASLFHGFYTHCRVLGEDAGLQNARLALVDATRITLRNVLQTMGLTAPERM